MTDQTVSKNGLIKEIKNLPINKYQWCSSEQYIEMNLNSKINRLPEIIINYEKEFDNYNNTFNTLAYHTTDNVGVLGIIKDGLIKARINKNIFTRGQESLKFINLQTEEILNKLETLIDLCEKETESTKSEIFNALKNEYFEKYINSLQQSNIITQMLDSDAPRVFMSDNPIYHYYNDCFSSQKIFIQGGNFITIVYKVEGLKFDRHYFYKNKINEMSLLVKEDDLPESLEYLESNRYQKVPISELSFKRDLPFERIERIYVSKDLEMQSIYIKQANGKFLRRDVINE